MNTRKIKLITTLGLISILFTGCQNTPIAKTSNTKVKHIENTQNHSNTAWLNGSEQCNLKQVRKSYPKTAIQTITLNDHATHAGYAFYQVNYQYDQKSKMQQYKLVKIPNKQLSQNSGLTTNTKLTNYQHDWIKLGKSYDYDDKHDNFSDGDDYKPKHKNNETIHAEIVESELSKKALTYQDLLKQNNVLPAYNNYHLNMSPATYLNYHKIAQLSANQLKVVKFNHGKWRAGLPFFEHYWNTMDQPAYFNAPTILYNKHMYLKTAINGFYVRDDEISEINRQPVVQYEVNSIDYDESTSDNSQPKYELGIGKNDFIKHYQVDKKDVTKSSYDSLNPTYVKNGFPIKLLVSDHFVDTNVKFDRIKRVGNFNAANSTIGDGK